MNRIAEEQRRTTPRDRARGVILRSEQTGGAFALVEYDIPPKRLVAPLHTHTREDEYSYVVSGTVGTQIGDEVVVGGVGELLSKPRGVPHTLWNPGDEWARVLEAISPGGFERCLEELQHPDASTRVSSPEDVARLMAEYEVVMEGRSVPHLLQRHGLAGVAVS